jgi:3-oxoacyl-[acyl-carrier-protein] synthase II
VVFEDSRGAAADISGLKEFISAKGLRQVDHFTRMALLCAVLALRDAGLDLFRSDIVSHRTGIVLATGYGPAKPTFDFLDSIITYGEPMASPLFFSHSVQNIPAASIAIKLGIVGPCLTVCQPDCPVTAALLAAWDWLDEGRVDRVLFGAVDELTPMLALASRRLVLEGRNGKNEKDVAPALPPLGEGAAFFCLDRETAGAKHGCITVVDMTHTVPGEEAAISVHTERERPMFISGYGLAETPQRGRIHAASGYGEIPVAQAFDMQLALGAMESFFALTPEADCVSVSRHGLTGLIRVARPGKPGGGLG